MRLSFLEPRFQKQLTNKTDYTKALDVKTQVGPVAAGLARAANSDPTVQAKIADNLDMLVRGAADPATGTVTVKSLAEYAETMAFVGSDALKNVYEALAAAIVDCLNNGGVPVQELAPSHEAQPLSTLKIAGEIQAQVAAGRLASKDGDKMLAALALIDRDDSGQVTLEHVSSEAARFAELSKFLSAQNDETRARGLKPALTELETALSVAESSFGAQKLNLFLMGAKGGELDRLVGDIKPGVRDQILLAMTSS